MTFEEFLKTLRGLGFGGYESYTFSELKAAYEAGFECGKRFPTPTSFVPLDEATQRRWGKTGDAQTPTMEVNQKAPWDPATITAISEGYA